MYKDKKNKKIKINDYVLVDGDVCIVMQCDDGTFTCNTYSYRGEYNKMR